MLILSPTNHFQNTHRFNIIRPMFFRFLSVFLFFCGVLFSGGCFYIKQSLSSGLQHLSNNDFVCMCVCWYWKCGKSEKLRHHQMYKRNWNWLWHTRHLLILCVYFSRNKRPTMKRCICSMEHYHVSWIWALALRHSPFKYSNFSYSSASTSHLACHTLPIAKTIEIKCVESFSLYYGFNVNISLYLCHRMRVNAIAIYSYMNPVVCTLTTYPDENSLLAIQWRGYDLNT